MGDPAQGQLKEDDSTSKDDKMGKTAVTCTPPEPTATSGFDCTTCGDVTNEGGELKGPNGVTQNGSVEGPCIEAKAEISVTYCAWVSGSHGGTVNGNGFTGLDLQVKCSEQKSVSDPPTNICPCAD